MNICGALRCHSRVGMGIAKTQDAKSLLLKQEREI